MKKFLAALCAVPALAACGAFSGSSFEAPDSPATPRGATVVATDHATDESDGRVRSTIQVVEMPDTAWPKVVRDYEAAYPAGKGWVVKESGTHLCLADTSNDDYTTLVEVWPYRGGRVPANPRRNLVTTTRVTPDKAACGHVTSHVPRDLLAPGGVDATY